MRIDLPLLKQELVGDKVLFTESTLPFDLDTSVYSEERWESLFPQLAERESLFQYIERIQETPVEQRVRVAAMLKAVFCFVESDKVTTYKEFAQMFNLATPEYTEKLISSIVRAFNAVSEGSAVKN